MCRALGVNRTSFHDWECRAPSDRALSDAWLTEKIKQIHADSDGTYGARRIHAELRLEHGIRVGRKRVERLMKAAGISGLLPRKRRRTTVRLPGVRVAPDLLERDFRPDGPNQTWSADITYISTWEGFLYLAHVQDLFSRLIVGWSMADHLRSELVVDALEMALCRRRPDRGLIHHSDQGCQLALLLYSYARGNRSSRGIERACWEDVTYKLITAMRVPDHSTIADFRRRHERALAELLTAVLALCEEAGLVEVGVISIDGMKIRANASRGANRAYEKLVADILKEAEETDQWEDGLFGSDRGDEVPEHLRTEEGRRAAFKAARERLAAQAGREAEPEVARIEPDPEQFQSTRGWGRRTWHREAHKVAVAPARASGRAGGAFAS